MLTPALGWGILQPVVIPQLMFRIPLEPDRLETTPDLENVSAVALGAWQDYVHTRRWIRPLRRRWLDNLDELSLDAGPELLKVSE